MQWPDLNQVLRDTPFAVVGAVAARLYAPERLTKDLDVVVFVAHIPTSRAEFKAAGWTRISELSIGGSSWRSLDGVEVDVLEGREAWWSLAIDEAQENRDAHGLPILPFPYLVLMKFRSGRTIDIGDITRMLGQAETCNLDKTRKLFAIHEPDGIDDLESLIELGRMEMQ